MTDRDEQKRLDHGLVAPVSIPPDSKIPEPGDGFSSEEEYDLYFRISRGEPGLLAWTRTCIQVQESMLHDLEQTELAAEDKYQILKGFLLIQRRTLERWAAIGEQKVEDDGKHQEGSSR